MEDDLNELARICLEHARATRTRKTAAALRRMAKDYQHRAAQSGKGNAPTRHRPANRKPIGANRN
jgi:hypothetical protein